jgi:hypothetical protein
VPRLLTLFDVFNVVLLVGGCLLLWLNLGVSRKALPHTFGEEVELPAPQNIYPTAELLPGNFDVATSGAHPDAVTSPWKLAENVAAIAQGRLEEFPKRELDENNGANLLDGVPTQEPNALTISTADQNGYASNVSTALAKSKEASANV